MKVDIYNSFEILIRHLIRCCYMGYDPYDGNNTKQRLFTAIKLARVVNTYLHKFSPINLRKIYGIRPCLQNQALAFIGRAMLVDNRKYMERINEIVKVLIKEDLYEKNGYHIWDAHGFPIQMKGSCHPTGMPDIIGTEAIGRFFLELYGIEEGNYYREMCISIAKYFNNELLIKQDDICFFKYTPVTSVHSWCYNASVIAASYIISTVIKFSLNWDLTDAKKTLVSVIDRQKPNGEWWYSINLKTEFEKRQIDFHQGFILDALLEYIKLIGYEEPYLSSYKKGLEFYYHKQFLPNGQSIYRYPKKWPVNIHNQAQGIITFSRAAKAGFGEHYLDFARKIAEWTIKNMQDEDGHFYYLKYSFFTNKIPYIRWSDAAMAYALAVFLEIRDQGLEIRQGRYYEKSENA